MPYTKHILVFAALLSLGAAYNSPDLPPGPYCGIDNNCCRDRKDDCSHKIRDTLCYCDEFCNRTHDDCCPDYATICLKELPPTPTIRPCFHQRVRYIPGEKRVDNCNVCECILDKPSSNATWHCEEDECLISNHVLKGVNRRTSSWRAANYTQFYGKKLQEGLTYKLGTFPLRTETKRMGAIQYDKDIPYPSDFDSRRRWPRFISPVVDQGWCGSDWAVSIASVVSDRFAILSNGIENVRLSPQTFLSCNVGQQEGCEGGHIDAAWGFVQGHGLVEEDCFPYKAVVTDCPYDKNGDLISDGCIPRNKHRTERYKVSPPGRVIGEKDIMYDIMQNGPAHAVMTVYQDFFHYHDGIYRRSNYGSQNRKGLHSVRILGWGEENGEKFWYVANSWGSDWGENGYFRIARGSDESGIESFVVTSWSDVPEANQK